MVTITVVLRKREGVEVSEILGGFVGKKRGLTKLGAHVIVVLLGGLHHSL